MELRHLRYFRTVGREEHFGRAAKILNIAQPALTRQIRHLEDELGVQLFERLPRGVRLSSAGRTFLSETETILAQVERAIEKTRSHASGHHGSLRVGFSEIASAHHDIPSKLLAFRLSEPNVTLDLLPMGSRNQIEALKDAKIDAAIIYDTHATDADLEVLDYSDIAVSDISLALYQGHRLTKAKKIWMKDLDGERFLWPIRSAMPRYYDVLTQAFSAHGVTPEIVQETATNSILLSLVAAGMGVGFVEYSENRYQSGNIILRKVEDLGISFNIRILWRKSDNSSALDLFLEAMAPS